MLLQNSDAKVRNLSMQTNTFPHLFLRNLRINISLFTRPRAMISLKIPLLCTLGTGILQSHRLNYSSREIAVFSLQATLYRHDAVTQLRSYTAS